MKWANALSTQPSLEAALREVVERARAQLCSPPTVASPESGVTTAGGQGNPADADLAIVFVSAAFASEVSRVVPLLNALLSVKILVGCSGGGIVGGGAEAENEPAVSLSLATLPGVSLQPFHIDADTLPDLDAPPQSWVSVIGVPQHVRPHFLLMADGFSSNISDLIQGLDFAYPGSTKVGGLASGGNQPKHNALFLNDELHRAGTVGLALSGNIEIDAVVAQGCRPIGDPLHISDAQRNVILELEDKVPLEVLQSTVNDLEEDDRKLVRNSLFAGMVMDEFKEMPEPGDFLIRNILGIDPRTGAIAIGDRLRSGQRIQFHLRDAQTSDDDLRYVLTRYCDHQLHQDDGGRPTNHPVGALMFSCLGRGQYLYGEPNHDTKVFQQIVGNVPMGGFFCNGEIGPVGGTTFLHGYTSVFALFRPSVPLATG